MQGTVILPQFCRCVHSTRGVLQQVGQWYEKPHRPQYHFQSGEKLLWHSNAKLLEASLGVSAPGNFIATTTFKKKISSQAACIQCCSVIITGNIFCHLILNFVRINKAVLCKDKANLIYTVYWSSMPVWVTEISQTMLDFFFLLHPHGLSSGISAHLHVLKH